MPSTAYPWVTNSARRLRRGHGCRPALASLAEKDYSRRHCPVLARITMSCTWCGKDHHRHSSNSSIVISMISIVNRMTFLETSWEKVSRKKDSFSKHQHQKTQQVALDLLSVAKLRTNLKLTTPWSKKEVSEPLIHLKKPRKQSLHCLVKANQNTSSTISNS